MTCGECGATYDEGTPYEAAWGCPVCAAASKVQLEASFTMRLETVLEITNNQLLTLAPLPADVPDLWASGKLVGRPERPTGPPKSDPPQPGATLISAKRWLKGRAKSQGEPYRTTLAETITKTADASIVTEAPPRHRQALTNVLRGPEAMPKAHSVPPPSKAPYTHHWKAPPAEAAGGRCRLGGNLDQRRLDNFDNFMKDTFVEPTPKLSAKAAAVPPKGPPQELMPPPSLEQRKKKPRYPLAKSILQCVQCLGQDGWKNP